MNRWFHLAPEAAEDIRAIWKHIAEDNVPAAKRFRLRLLSACQQLGRNPGMGHRRTDLIEDLPLLFWPVGSYLVMYRAGTRSPIEVAAVAHASWDIPTLMRRRSTS